MGFFSALGKMAASAAGSAMDKARDLNEAKLRLSEYSNDRLIDIYKGRSGFDSERVAAFNILKERGYSAEDLKYM